MNEKPFSLNADARFVYESPTYTATRESLLADIRRREGLLVLTGQIGTGKTTLCRSVLAGLGRNTYSSMVPDPFASREDLLKMLLIDFGVVSIQDLTAGPLRQASRTELGYLLSEFLSSLSSDAFVVVVIDEAQNLALPLIEETRILSDTFGAQGRLQIVFVGQPELHAKLKSPEMRQVDQRVCGYHRLAPMSREAVSGYLQHRLLVAGNRRARVLFPPEIVDSLHSRSGGVPRLINRVCDRALHLAFDRRAEQVDREILDTALLEVGSATLSPTWDSIMFAESPAPVPAAVSAPPPAAAPAAVAAPAPVVAPAPPTVVPAAAVDIALPADNDEMFDQQVATWVEQELAAPSRPLTRRHGAPADETRVAPPVKTQAPARSSSRRAVPARAVTAEWPRDLRSETYMQRLLRLWVKRGAIAVAAFVCVNVAMVGASLLPAMLGPGPLPAAPEAPLRVLPSIALPQAVEAEAAADAAPVSSAGSVDYLVAVGLFASVERADQLVDQLTREGLPAMQRPVQFRGRLMQQIVLGPFLSRPDAIADLVRLQLLGGYQDARVIDGARDPLAQ